MCKPGSVGDLGGQPPRSTRPKSPTPSPPQVPRGQVSPASGLQDLTQVASNVGAPADAEAVNPIPTAHRRGTENHVQSGRFLLFLAIRRFDRIKAEVTHGQ